MRLTQVTRTVPEERTLRMYFSPVQQVDVTVTDRSFPVRPRVK